MSLEGTVYVVRLLEIATKKIKFHQNGRIIWPLLGKDGLSATIDGVLLLHDTTQSDSFSRTTNIVGMFLLHTRFTAIATGPRWRSRHPHSMTFSDMPSTQTRCP